MHFVFEYAAWRASHIRTPIERLKYLRACPKRPETSGRRRLVYSCWTSLLAMAVAGGLGAMRSQPGHPPETSVATSTPPATSVVHADVPRIWQVEEGADYESYSNGLRIDTRLTVAHIPRSYAVFEGATARHRTIPAGIVFHSTENDLLPFDPDRTREILKTTFDLLHYVQEHRAYHFVIDRFGRVYKIVRGSDAADHAGRSVWWSRTAICVNLNHAFLGVAFEGRTESPLTPAQIDSGRLLTGMLRSRFDIPAEDCVTHAQVSVNPSNGLIGWHTDLARQFPFAALSLPDNYQRMIPSISELGFGYDAAYLRTAGSDLSAAVRDSFKMSESAAHARGVPATRWRRSMLDRYRLLVDGGND